MEETLFSPREFLLATRDAGYRGLAAAIAELIDNSIQAGSKRIAVLIKISDPGERSPTITVSDDGNGMSRHTLGAALRFGTATGRDKTVIRAVGFIDWLGGKYNRCNSTSSSFRGHRI
jgi:hypothetical protein